MEAIRTKAAGGDPFKQAMTHALALWAVVLPLWILTGSALSNTLGLDFRGAFLPAAHAVSHGLSPYSAIGSHTLAIGKGFLYPPLTAYLVAPFTLLPTTVAYGLAVALVAVTVPVTLLLVGVRDWRCHAIAFMWLPIIVGIQTANVTLPMILGLAIVWHYRDRPVVAALVSGLLIALKVFFWPLLVWLVATRRYRTAALAAGVSVVLVLVPWAGIGFAGLRGYPHLLSTVSRLEGPHSYSLAALLAQVLRNWTAAVAVETVLGAVLLLRAVVAGRQRRKEAFALALLAILVLTPLLEMHYLAVLLIVVGLYRPRFGPAWAAPLLIYGAPVSGGAATTPQVVRVFVVVVLTVALAFGDWRSWATRLSLVLPKGRLSKWLATPGRKGAGPSLAPP